MKYISFLLLHFFNNNAVFLNVVMVVLIFFSGAAVIQAVTFVAPLKVDINQELKMGILVVILVGAYYCSVQPCFTIQISSSDTPSEDLSTEYLWKTHYNHRLIAVSLFCCCCCRPVLCMHLFRCYTDINLLTLRAAKSVQIQANCSFSSVSSLFYLLLSLLCPSGCFKFLMSPNEVLNQ